MTRVLRLSRVAGAVALALVAAACGSGSGERPTNESGLKTLTAVSQPNGAGLSLYIAKKLGYFEKEGLDVTIKTYASGPASLTAGASGEWQAGWLGAPPALTGGVQYKLVLAGLMIREDENHVMYMNTRTLKGRSPAEVLKTERVATAQNTLADQVMRGCAEHLGADSKAIEVVPLEGGQIVQALTSGKVNVVNTWSSPGYKLIDDPKYKAVCDAKDAGVAVVDPFVVNPKFAKDDPKTAAAFLRAAYRANAYINDSPEEAVEMMKELFQSIGIKPAEGQAEYETKVRKWQTLDQAIKGIESGRTNKALKASAEFFVEAGVYPEAPPIDDLLKQGLELLRMAKSGA